ncbi:MAG TPA: hypothetical protein VK705_06590 [Ferruginibacter sp.]|jgi:hypothetical protein|nr:hypothetical protein [Ferruginibacter sp.]
MKVNLSCIIVSTSKTFQNYRGEQQQFLTAKCIETNFFYSVSIVGNQIATINATKPSEVLMLELEINGSYSPLRVTNYLNLVRIVIEKNVESTSILV